MSIREEISKFLDFGITVDKDGKTDWDGAFYVLQRENRINNKHIVGILKMLIKREEAREQMEAKLATPAPKKPSK